MERATDDFEFGITLPCNSVSSIFSARGVLSEQDKFVFVVVAEIQN